MNQLTKLKDSGLVIPTPAKGKTRNDTIQYATLFAIKVADDYIKSKSNGTVNGYIEFLDTICWEKFHEIKDKSKEGKWEIKFDKDDIYSLEGQKVKIAEDEAIEKLTATNRYIKSLVRLFWDDCGNESEDLKKFINWLPKFITQLQYAKN